MKPPSFSLRDSSIVLNIPYGSKRPHRYTTDYKINPDHWDKKRERIKIQVQGASKINGELTKMEESVSSQLEQIARPTLENVLEILEQFDTKPKDKLTFTEFFKKWYEDREGHTGLEDFKHGKVAYNRWEEFNTARSVKVSFHNLNERTIKEYIKSLFDKGYLNNTVGSYLKFFSRCCKAAVKQKYLTCMDFMDFTNITEEVKQPCPTEEEIDLLYKCKKFSPEMKEAVDRYIFAYEAGGMRFSDTCLIRPEMIVNFTLEDKRIIKIVDFTQVKTKGINSVALTKRALEIIARYEGKYEKCFKKTYGQKINPLIKEAFNILKLRDKIVQIRHSGQNRIETVYERWELLGFHTARYAASATVGNKDIYLAQQVMGHKDIKTTLKYTTKKDQLKHSQYLELAGE